MHYLRNHPRQSHGGTNALQVDERRIPYYAGICPENPETDDVEDHVHEYRLAQQYDITQSDGSVVIEPEHKDACEIAYQAVEYEHYPIRECVFCEVPV